MQSRLKAAIKKLIVRAVPLSLRKGLAIWINRQTWLGASRGYWATELLTDFARRDVNAYHKFLWRHHLSYAETYEIDLRFGPENLNETRAIFFAELPRRFEEAKAGSVDEVQSVLEIGCSLGYLLRHMETGLFANATRLEGIDIDKRAIANGSAYLERYASKIRLHLGDMESMDELFKESKFDFVLASGVLLYLDEPSAFRLVEKMLGRTQKLLAITALAHPEVDNGDLEESVPRASDGTWIHNVDRMIEHAGGRVVSRRCEHGRLVDGNTIYFLYAIPSTNVP